MSIEDLNYMRDPRTQSAPTQTVTIWDDITGRDTEHELPTTWALCSVCNGEGKHVNPSIDAGGISAEQFHEDPDFHDDYFSGAYDVSCYRCHGRTTEKVIDWDQVNPVVRDAWEEQCEAEAQIEAEHRAERAMGA